MEYIYDETCPECHKPTLEVVDHDIHDVIDEDVEHDIFTGLYRIIKRYSATLYCHCLNCGIDIDIDGAIEETSDWLPEDNPEVQRILRLREGW